MEEERAAHEAAIAGLAKRASRAAGWPIEYSGALARPWALFVLSGRVTGGNGTAFFACDLTADEVQAVLRDLIRHPDRLHVVGNGGVIGAGSVTWTRPGVAS